MLEWKETKRFRCSLVMNVDHIEQEATFESLTLSVEHVIDVDATEEVYEWWNWSVVSNDGDIKTGDGEGVSFRSEEEAKMCAELIARVLACKGDYSLKHEVRGALHGKYLFQI